MEILFGLGLIWTLKFRETLEQRFEASVGWLVVLSVAVVSGCWWHQPWAGLVTRLLMDSLVANVLWLSLEILFFEFIWNQKHKSIESWFLQLFAFGFALLN